MNDYCFAKDDGDPNDWCGVCDPERSREKFVQRLGQEYCSLFKKIESARDQNHLIITIG